MPSTGPGPEDAARVLRESDCIYDAAAVAGALDSLAGSITQAYGDINPLLLVVMTGGFVFAGQLLTRLNFPLQVDYLHATRYRSGTRGHEVEWRVAPKISLQDRHVLVIDDILDEGHTLHAVLGSCRDAGAASVKTAVLVEKLHDRKYQGIKADFSGLDVEDRYVFGYGLDYHEYLRNAPGIYAVPDSLLAEDA
ncbi:hypoxanthine-guanine phosphoribosyltransferase [Acidihalobacter aeolianus]|uniref:Hypoxanthine-guanine phosphoribosyltransferase n=1 Tax=Acidihalobacter aeolianus TaxID=2792603 RepID=A0A1D8KC69_9GAMM|nr:hypoxanthine-guanine phosphoribosyltransferase [Acidihalobacter aeolianus]